MLGKIFKKGRWGEIQDMACPAYTHTCTYIMYISTHT